MDAEEGKEMIRAMAGECKTEAGASDDDVENMIAKKMPDSKPSKCLNACMMKLFNIVNIIIILQQLTKASKTFNLIKSLSTRWKIRNLIPKA